MNYTSTLTYKSKFTQLKTFLALFGDEPEQGSDLWLKKREKTIGGSEMSIIEGTNPYQDVKSLIQTKLGYNLFRGNPATDWGKVFEPAVQRHLELRFQCPIYETGSLPGCVTGTSYSPDGFAVALKARLEYLQSTGEILPHTLIDDAISILFEIKSPARRKPKWIVPKHYMSQPKSGLCHFPFLDIAYFVDAAFRTAAVLDLSCEYNYAYHKDKETYNTPPIALGIIGIYTKTEYSQWTTSVNYSAVGWATFNEMLKSTASNKGINCAYYFEPITADQFTINKIDAQKSQFDQFCEKNDYAQMGYISYKMFRCDIIPIYRDPLFVKNLIPEINQVMAIIDKVKKSDNHMDKINEIFHIESKPVECQFVHMSDEFMNDFK